MEIFRGRLTYPTLVCGPDDTLFLTGRFGWEGVRLYVKRPGKKWEDCGLIIKRQVDCFSYAAFHEGLRFSGKTGRSVLSFRSLPSKSRFARTASP